MKTTNKRMGLGLYSLTGVYGKKDRAEINRMLEYAIDAGIKYYDVADQYGPAEEVLGSILKMHRSRVEISTKVGMNQDGMGLSSGYIKEACKKSLKRLNTDYIDYYQIHYDDEETFVEEIVTSLEELQKEGLIRKYGLGHTTMERFIEFTKVGNPAFLMLEVSLAVTKNYEKYWPVCNENGIEIVAMSTTARGLLTGTINSKEEFAAEDIRKIDPLFHRNMFKSALRIVDKLKECAKKTNKTPVQVALSWIKGLDGVKTILVGPSTVDHLKENIGGFEFQLPSDIRLELDTFIAQEEEKKAEGLICDIEDIIDNPVPDDIRIAIADLVYVLEGLISLGKSSSQFIAPIFKDLLSVSTDEKVRANRKLAIIKEKIASIYRA